MKRIAQITLMALIISIAQPAELQAWSLSSNQKLLGAAAVVVAALYGIYLWSKPADASPSAQQDSDTEGPHPSWYRPTSSLFGGPRTPSFFDEAENRPTRAPRESDTSPSGPIPAKIDFKLANNNETAQFVLKRVQEFVQSHQDENLYLSRYNEWGIRLSITKINDTTLRVSFSTWKATGRGVDNQCAIFNKTGAGWTLNQNSTNAIADIVSTNLDFTSNTNALRASFVRLCTLVKGRL